MRKIGILCACEKELTPYIENMYNRNTTEYAMILDTVVCTASEFRDTDNEIYSDFPIMEKPVFHADKHLCEIARAAAAHACYMCNIPFIAIRSISDNNNDKGQEAISRNFDKAAYQSYRFVDIMLALLN